MLPLKAKPPFRHPGVSQTEVENGIKEADSALDSKASLGVGFVSILRGETSAQEAARKHGLTVAELE